MQRRLGAYSFRSPFTLEEVFDTLNRAGPWQWRKRDNDSWGDYISAGVLPGPHFGIVHIIEEDGAYVLNIRLRFESGGAAEREEHFSAVHDIVLNAILPAIQADRIERTEPRER